MKAKLTTKLINSLKPEQAMYKVWDTEIKGFFLRVFPSGKMTYALHYRHEGLARDYTIDAHGKITATVAREIAKDKSGEVARGKDIQAEKKAARRRKQIAKYETLEGFIKYKYKSWALSELKRGQGALDTLRNNFKHLYSRKLDNITPWDIQKWRSEKLNEGLNPATLNRQLTVLKSLLSKAVLWEVISTHPLAKVKPLKIDRQAKVRYLTDEEEGRLRGALDAREDEIRAERASANEWRRERGYDLMDDLKGQQYADHLKPLVLLAMNTGMRRGELFNLVWADVNLKGKLLTVEGGGAKSGTTRHIPLNNEALGVLIGWRNQTDCRGLVFPSPRTGERMDNIKKGWVRLINLASIEDFRFHDLRHHFASKLVMAGVDLNTIRELLGHTTLEMTLRYAHLAPEHKAAAVELLNQN